MGYILWRRTTPEKKMRKRQRHVIPSLANKLNSEAKVSTFSLFSFFPHMSDLHIPPGRVEAAYPRERETVDRRGQKVINVSPNTEFKGRYFRPTCPHSTIWSIRELEKKSTQKNGYSASARRLLSRLSSIVYFEKDEILIKSRCLWKFLEIVSVRAPLPPLYH